MKNVMDYFEYYFLSGTKLDHEKIVRDQTGSSL